ncbi:MAG: hypothetical protein NZ570_06595, partial [Candidatus Caldarchaeum sp.]|nr:hypothetical protein [Candidatus Caldarchaeum sp.]
AAPVPVVFALFLTALKKLRDHEKPQKLLEGSELSIFIRSVPVIAPSLFIVGVELGFATWLPSLLSIRYSGIGVGLSVAIFTVFMGLGRTFLGRIADVLGPIRSITYLGGCTAFSFLCFSLVNDFTTKLMILPVIGLVVGPLLPTFTAWVITIYPAHGGSVAGMVISFGRVGTFFVNWMVGLVLGLFGELSAVMVFLLSCLIMVVYLNLLVRLMGLGVGHRRA